MLRLSAHDKAEDGKEERGQLLAENDRAVEQREPEPPCSLFWFFRASSSACIRGLWPRSSILRGMKRHNQGAAARISNIVLRALRVETS